MKLPDTPKQPIDPDAGQVMEFFESMQYIEKQGFRWERFGDFFPFGPRIHSEGQWEKLVAAAVKSIRIPVDQELLLDLIDAQLCVYGERCDAINQKLGEDDFRGELVPQDPNDEPAQKMLARFKTAKATESPKAPPRGRKLTATTQK